MGFLSTNRPQGTTQVGVRVDQAAFDDADSFLAKLPFELRNKVVVKAIRETGKIYQLYLTAELEAKLNSEMTGTREKQSQKTKAERPETHLFQTVIVKVGAYSSLEIGVVGPAWPSGNIVNLYVTPHVQPLWGKVGSSANPITQPVAYDIAARVALSAESFIAAKFTEEIKSGVESAVARLARQAKRKK